MRRGSGRVELHVAFLPEEAGDCRRRAVAVVDVIRATTSLLIMAERGCDEVLIAPNLEVARAYAAAHPGVLLAGEQAGLAPAGFDFGNSPAALMTAPLAVVACLRNRTAAARALAAAARAFGLDPMIVCAGREGRFGLDDAYTAGAMVEAMCAGEGAPVVELTDAAMAARDMFRAHPDAASLFRRTSAGRHVVEIGLDEDLGVCAQLDRSADVPRVGERVRLLDA